MLVTLNGLLRTCTTLLTTTPPISESLLLGTGLACSCLTLVQTLCRVLCAMLALIRAVMVKQFVRLKPITVVIMLQAQLCLLCRPRTRCDLKQLFSIDVMIRTFKKLGRRCGKSTCLTWTEDRMVLGRLMKVLRWAMGVGNGALALDLDCGSCLVRVVMVLCLRLLTCLSYIMKLPVVAQRWVQNLVMLVCARWLQLPLLVETLQGRLGLNTAWVNVLWVLMLIPACLTVSCRPCPV